MARFSEAFIQQVAQATDIVELVSQYVALKPRGREYVGLCPFHDDRRPSMYVSPAKQIFKCFACGAGGGVFQFLMLYDKMPFPEAVRALAERARIPVPADARRQQAAPGLSRQDLLQLTAWAARFYRNQLTDTPAGAKAMEYAQGRGLTDASITRFGLGYAPDAWDSLYNAARSAGFSDKQLTSAGLVSQSDRTGGLYDRFRHRLIFPIFDVAGQVVAFGGRALGEDRAKYLNSPEGPLFDKSSLLYGLNWSRRAISDSNRAVVVEGYLDALIPLQAGVENIAATLGTALTDRHVRLLSRYASEAVLVFDADEAGNRAAERGLELFLAQQSDVRVATIPAGKDPCDYVLSDGPEAFAALIDQAPDALQYVWQRRQEAYNATNSLAKRRQVIEDFLRVVVSSAAYGAIDDVRRGQLAQHIAHMLNLSPTELNDQMRRLGRRIQRRSARPEDARPAAGGSADLLRVERQILEAILSRPELFETAMERLSPEDFADPALHAAARRVWNSASGGMLDIEALLASETDPAMAGLLVEMTTAGQDRGNEDATLGLGLEALEERRHRQEIGRIKDAGLTDENLLRLQEKLRRPSARKIPRIQ